MQILCKASPRICSAHGLRAAPQARSPVITPESLSLPVQPLHSASPVSPLTQPFHLTSLSILLSISLNAFHTTMLRLDRSSQTNVAPAVDSTAPIQINGRSASPRHPVLPDGRFYKPAITNNTPLMPLATLSDS
jgi:hypothetical protein